MNRALILGWDGAAFSVLDSLIEAGVMPNLARFMASGVRATLRSTVPPLTPVAWTSLVTGKHPGRHGITGFFQFESPESFALRITSARDLQAETLWPLVNRSGLRAGSLNFPMHCPPPRIDGYIIPGWLPWKWIKRFSHPADLVERLLQVLPDLDLEQLAMDFEQEKKSIAGIALNDPEEWIALHLRRDRQWFDVLRYQMQNDPCELTGVVFDGVDKLQHLLWTFLDPRLAPAAPDASFLRTRELCWRYFRQLDGFLGELETICGPEASIFIVSDHGFTGTSEILHINTWLESEGYLVWKPDLAPIPDDCQELEPEFYQLAAFDMERTRAFALTASSNGIHIVTRGPRSEYGIDPEDYVGFRDELKRKLLTDVKDPATGQPLISKVWTREEAFAGSAMGIAPDLTVELRDNGFFSVRRSTRLLTQRPSAMGTHHPDGIFVANGPAIRKAAFVDALRLVDVAPTVLHALGLPIPADFDGKVADGIFTSEYSSRKRPAHATAVPVAATAVAAAPAEAFSYAPADEEQLLERLRSLGYLE